LVNAEMIEDMPQWYVDEVEAIASLPENDKRFQG
jgi:hypothetical protein